MLLVPPFSFFPFFDKDHLPVQAAYIINGNCKNVMNMSQPDQLELWRSVYEGRLSNYKMA